MTQIPQTLEFHLEYPDGWRESWFPQLGPTKESLVTQALKMLELAGVNYHLEALLPGDLRHEHIPGLDRALNRVPTGELEPVHHFETLQEVDQETGVAVTLAGAPDPRRGRSHRASIGSTSREIEKQEPEPKTEVEIPSEEVLQGTATEAEAEAEEESPTGREDPE